MSTHFQNDEILRILDGESEGDRPRGELDEHVGTCPPCAEHLREAERFLDAVRDSLTWSTIPPNDAAAAVLADVERRLRREDRDAASLLSSLDDMPRAEWTNALQSAPVTVGLLHTLSARAHDLIERDPAEAYDLAVLTTALAERLPDAPYPTIIVLQARAGAWKERASALRYLGRYPEALEAVEHAERLLEAAPAGAFDLAGVTYVRAYILASMNRFDEADQLFATSGQTYASFGEHARAVHSRLMQGIIRFERGDVTGARDIFLMLLEPIRGHEDVRTMARILSNLAICSGELHQAEEAVRYFLQALNLYEELGMETEKTRVRWNLGMLFTQTGKLEQGLVQLEQASDEFTRFGMVAEVGLVGLAIAEALLAAGRPAVVPALCKELVERFTAAGMTQSAITALSYLREASSAGRATPELAKYLRTYLERLPEQPDLVFAPPPEPPN